MNTTLGKELARRFPSIAIGEDVFTEDHYWIDISLTQKRLVVEATPKGFGISVVIKHSSDFGGHDCVVESIDQALELLSQNIAEDMAVR